VPDTKIDRLAFMQSRAQTDAKKTGGIGSSGGVIGCPSIRDDLRSSDGQLIAWVRIPSEDHARDSVTLTGSRASRSKGYNNDGESCRYQEQDSNPAFSGHLSPF
jgi:hypothetical protein